MTENNRAYKKGFDKITWGILIATFVLCSMGIVALYSASYSAEGPFFQRVVGRQLIWIIVGIISAIIVSMFRSKLIYNYSYFLYGAGIVLILLPYFFPASEGAKRWITVGVFQYQPSEIMKILSVIAIAKYFTNTNISKSDFKIIFFPLTMILIPTGIVMNQPDLGTAMIYIGLLFPMMFWAGVDWINIFLLVAPLISILSAFNYYTFFIWLIIFAIVIYFQHYQLWKKIILTIANVSLGLLSPVLWDQLQPYQQQRILTLFNVKTDPQGAGYQVIQSQVAIGSGGLFGKGLLQGKQTHLKFLPEQKTDFIFSVIGEEWGFIGVSLVLLSYFFLIYFGIKAAYNSRDQYNSIVIIGLVSIIFYHVIINTSMTIGLMPVTGLPLPFISYGGSFLTTCCILLGLLFGMKKESKYY